MEDSPKSLIDKQIKKSRRSTILVLFVLFLLLAVSRAPGQEEGVGGGEHTVRIGEYSIFVEIADSESKRTQGLGGRHFLPQGNGMLFIFPDERRHGIWMKGMNFALDVLWLQDDKVDRMRVVSMRTGIAPETFPEVFYPDEDARYVLELSSGSVERLGIETGQIVTLRRGSK